MRKVKRTELLLLLLPVVLLAGVAVTIRLKEADDENLKQAIVGKWRAPNGFTMEIHKADNRSATYKAENTYKGKKIPRTYKFVDNNHIQIDGPGLPSGVTIIAKVKISGDKLIISYEDTNASLPVEEFERAK